MNQDLKYLQVRVLKLVQTGNELKEEFKKSKNPVLEDLYLEIECYTMEMSNRIKQIERRKLWQKPKKKK